MQWNRDDTRHLLMRLGLGFVLGWFGIQELRSPGQWAVFVPSFVAHASPIAVNDLILLHGFLLVVAASLVVLGLLYLPGSLLAMALIFEIVFGLWYDGGVNDLVIRDVGLFALASALAFDSNRFLHLDTFLARPRWAIGHRFAGSHAPWVMRGGGAVALTGIIIAAGVVLHATGNGGGGALDNSSLSLANPPSTPAATSAPRGAATSTPVPGTASTTPSAASVATTVLFNSWRYKSDSYQVYPGTPSDQATKAASGFAISVQDQGDSVLVSLKAISPRYKDAQFVVPPGDTAYFVETSMNDDPSDQENNLGDDGLVVVDTQGYILQS